MQQIEYKQQFSGFVTDRYILNKIKWNSSSILGGLLAEKTVDKQYTALFETP